MVISVKSGAGRWWRTRPTGENKCMIHEQEVERSAIDNDRTP
jgi:hypothetical protein